MGLHCRSAILDFVAEVTSRHGSLEAYFAEMRRDPDDEPTLILPVFRTPAPACTTARSRELADTAIGALTPIPTEATTDLWQAPELSSKKGRWRRRR
ncbi:hypothetical protein ACWEVD_19300 [Nocardia thailandica]